MSHSNGHSTTTSKSSSSGKFFGITPPINTNYPTESDQRLTQSMLTTLEQLGYTESREESRKRESVLAKLNLMVKEFVRKVGEERGLPDFILNEAGGKIFTFGSYRLGVHQSGKQINVSFILRC